MHVRHPAPLFCCLILSGCQQGHEAAPPVPTPTPVASAPHDAVDATAAAPTVVADPPATPEAEPLPAREPPTVNIKFSTDSGRIVSQTAVENKHRSSIMGFHGASGSVYLADKYEGDQILRVLDGSGATRELKRWPNGHLRQIHLDQAGNFTAVVVAYKAGLILESFDAAGKGLGTQTIAGDYEAVTVALGSGNPVVVQRSGVARARPRETLALGAPLTFEPRSAAFDTQGFLVVAGAASRGGAPTVKFNPELRPVWERRYERPGDEQADVVIAGADDKVCAGGITETLPIDGSGSHHGESYATDVWIRCYSGQGKQLWDGRYNAANDCGVRAEQDHTLTSMAFAPGGGIVFVGTSCKSPAWIQKVSDRGGAGWRIEIQDLHDPSIAIALGGQIGVAGKLAHDVSGPDQWVWRAFLAPQ